MEKWKKIGKRLLFPPMALLWVLLPVAAALLVYAMTVLGGENPVSIAAYVLAAYTLTIWCCRIPRIISFARKVKRDNKYFRIWTGDVRLRMGATLFGGFTWNGLYAIFQLWLGVYHGSFWYCSMAAYHGLLAIMRLSLAGYTCRHNPGEDMPRELRKYRNCGVVLLVMNLVLGMMVFFMVCWNRTFRHHQITTIAMAAYTFFSFTMAIINVVKFRRIGSPVYSASKAIALASACVSMLTLESTMLTAFGGETTDLITRRIFLGATGAAVSLIILAMAVSMITRANQQLKGS